MKEIEADNPGAQWLYADPRSWEWKNLPNGNGLDLADYIEDGATQDDLLASITSQSKHKGQDGKPSYEEIISSIEQFVGLYVSDVRISYETVSWLEARGVKMSQANIDKLIHEAKERVYGRQELDTIDALEIAKDDKCREWLIAGILPLGSVMLLGCIRRHWQKHAHLQLVAEHCSRPTMEQTALQERQEPNHSKRRALGGHQRKAWRDWLCRIRA
jgi:hypothetical protein